MPDLVVVDVKRAAAAGLQIQLASGGMHGRHRQAIAPGKPELTIQAKGLGLTSYYAIGP
jgi:hypothetical protein